MQGIHIIVLFACSILLLAIYFIAKIHTRQNVIRGEQDYITTSMVRLEKHIREISGDFKVEWYLIALIVSPLVVGIIGFLGTESGPMGVIIGCLGFFVPEGIIQYIKMNNNKKFEERYSRSLEQLGSSLRAGLSITQAVEDTANCKFLHESMRKEYAKMSSDLQMGLTIAETFQKFAERCNSEDARDVALAIDVQNEVGGHEADVIKEIANNINRRMMLRREIKSIFSSTSSMIWMMDVIAPLSVIGFAVMNPSYIQVYFSNPVYTAILALIIGMIAAGTFINHKALKRISKGA